MSRRAAARVPVEVATAVCTTLCNAVVYLEQFREASTHCPPEGRGDPTMAGWYRCTAVGAQAVYLRLRNLYTTLRVYSRGAFVVRGSSAVTVRRVTGVLAYVTATLSPWDGSGAMRYIHAGRAMSSLNQMRNVLRELDALDISDGSASGT